MIEKNEATSNISMEVLRYQSRDEKGLFLPKALCIRGHSREGLPSGRECRTCALFRKRRPEVRYKAYKRQLRKRIVAQQKKINDLEYQLALVDMRGCNTCKRNQMSS